MRSTSLRLLTVCAAAAALACGEPEPPIVGRPATEAEKDAMPGFLVTLDRREITILSPLRPELPGCTVVLDNRWGAVIPPQESPIAARVPLAAFADQDGQRVRGIPTRVEITCAGESGDVRYTGRRSASGTVTAWIYPD